MPQAKIAKHGGGRPGAGRPVTSAARQSDEYKKIAKQIKGALGLGLDKLAEKYPHLMETAIWVAEGRNENGIRTEKPNVAMLKFLLELPVRLVDWQPDGQPATKGSQLIKELLVEGDVNIYRGGDGVPADVGRTFDSSARVVRDRSDAGAVGSPII